MNTSLLACIRGASVRIRSAESAARQRRPVRFRIMMLLAVFRDLTQVAQSRCDDAAYFLPGYPRPNSKSAHVYDELLAAGVPRHAILHAPEAQANLVRRAARLLSSLPWAICVLITVIFRQRRFDRIALQVILGREAYRRWLRSCPEVHPIIISDVSPGLHMLWSAAAAEGNRAIWWQDDFHHASALPYPIRAAAVLNLPGLESAEARGVAFVAARPTSPPVPLKPLSSSPIGGMATNAFFVANEQQLQRLTDLVEQLGISELQLRLHPNSSLVQEDFAGTPVRVARFDEPMESFANRIDLAIVGNTAAQLWLLRNGTPVIHIAGLDEQGYDAYGYARRGLVLGVPNISEISLNLAFEFYSKNGEEISKLLCEFTTLGTREDIKGLELFAIFCSRRISADARVA